MESITAERSRLPSEFREALMRRQKEKRMHPRERLDYSPIHRRPPLRFPEGIRLVVWPLVALEEWDLSRPMARMVISPPQGQPQLPDLPNWSWHEYGMRVGVLAAEENARAPGRLADGHAECESVRDLSAGDRGLHRQRMGTQCPQLRSSADAQAR